VRKAKWSIVVAAFVCAVQLGAQYYHTTASDEYDPAKDPKNAIQYYERSEDSDDPMQPWEMMTFAKVEIKKGPDRGKWKYPYVRDGETTYYDLMQIDNYSRGRIVKFSNQKEVCTSGWILPGTDILPVPLLAIAYFVTLCWLFLGISIVADIFMSAIEKITSQTTTVLIKNNDGTTTP